MYFSSQVELAVRLNNFGLLNEENRRIFVEAVSAYAVSGEDPYALEAEGIRSMFIDVEFEELVATIRAGLLPMVASVRQEVQDSFDAEDLADEHMDHMLENFKTLRNVFREDLEAIQTIEHEINRAKNWISENKREIPEIEARLLGAAASIDMRHGSRSIFDDIDA